MFVIHFHRKQNMREIKAHILLKIFRSQSKIYIYKPVLHSHTVLMKLCLPRRYRQLNLVLYLNNHILKLSKTIFNRFKSLIRSLVLAGNLKVGKPRLCYFSSKLNTDSFIRSIYHNICMLIP